jgi:hypothetical protein
MSEKPNGHASDSVGLDCDLADSIEAAKGAIILRSQLTELQITAARNAERATIETLCQDAMHRYIKARKANDLVKEVGAVREILRFELYLSRRGFV